MSAAHADIKNIWELPHDAIAEIFSHLDLPSFMRCRQLCRDFCIASIRTRGIHTSQVEIIDALGNNPSQASLLRASVLRCISRVTDARKGDALCQWAAGRDDQDLALIILKWARNHKIHTRRNICSWSTQTCSSAARRGHLGVLIWLRNPRNHMKAKVCPWSAKSCDYAALGGHLDVIKWLRDPHIHGKYGFCKWSSLACINAAYCKRQDDALRVLKWLRDPKIHGKHGACPWSQYTCGFAALRGHAILLKWLRDPIVHGRKRICPWNDCTCSFAASIGRLDILRWLRDPNAHCDASLDGSVCPWRPEDARSSAAKRGHHGVVKWILENSTESERQRELDENQALDRYLATHRTARATAF